MEMFRQFLSAASPCYHLFGVVELRFAQEVDDVFAQINGFSVLHQDRNRHGGGVPLYINNNYKATILCSSVSQSAGKPGIPEYLMCRVQQGKLPPVFVAVVYRPPDIPLSTFINSELISDLRKYSVGYDYRIVWVI